MDAYFFDTLLSYRSNITMVAIGLMIMGKEGYQKDMTHPSFFQLHRGRKLACLPNGSHPPTSILRTTRIWYATEERSHDSSTSSGLSPTRMPYNLDQ